MLFAISGRGRGEGGRQEEGKEGGGGKERGEKGARGQF